MGRDPDARMFMAGLVTCVEKMDRDQMSQKEALDRTLSQAVHWKDPRASKRAVGGRFMGRCSRYTVVF